MKCVEEGEQDLQYQCFGADHEKETVALQKLQACLDHDLVHSVPYYSSLNLHEEHVRNAVDLFQIGQRFGARSKHDKIVKCSVCGNESHLDVFPKAKEKDMGKRQWTCRHCTVRNELPEEPHAALELLTMGVGKMQDLLIKSRPGMEEMAEVVRGAVQCAILEGSGRKEAWEAPSSVDYLAVDRSMRGASGAGLKAGLLTIYAPFVMRHLRHLFGVTEDGFCESLLEHSLVGKANSGGSTASLFFFSEDRRFVVKSVAKNEAAKLREMLAAMVDYVRKNRDTLLPRVFGLFKIAGE